MSAASHSLRELADSLRAEDSVISPCVVAPDGAVPVLGHLAAGGPRTARHQGEYALVVEAVREGYLLHYERGRVVTGCDPDLALLAGDYLYAFGLERLAALGDLDAVRELSDLISLAAQVHDAGRSAERIASEARALWLGCAIAIATGPSAGHEDAKAALGAQSLQAAAALLAAAERAASEAGIGDELELAADAIDFRQNPFS